MKWLFDKVVGGPWCFHKWETKQSCPVMDPKTGGDLPVYMDKHLCCTKCGDWKKVRL